MRLIHRDILLILSIAIVPLVFSHRAAEYSPTILYDPPLDFDYDDAAAMLEPQWEPADDIRADVPYNPVVCRNSLIPFVYNYSTTPPTLVPYRQAIRVLIGTTFNVALMLNSTAECPYALISVSSYAEKPADVFLTNEKGPWVNMSSVPVRRFVNVSVTGKLIGYSAIKITVHSLTSPDNETLFSDCQDKIPSCKFVTVSFFTQGVADDIYAVITILFTVFCQLDIGLRTKLITIITLLKKPLPFVVGMSCHFILMPLIAFALAKIIDVGSPELAMGFFFAGIVSGNGLSNLHTKVLGGDYELSTLMTWGTQILTLGFTPMWLAIFEPLIVTKGVTLAVPFADISITIAEMIIPALVGFGIRYIAPKLAVFLRKFVTFPIVIITFLYYASYGLYTYLWMFQYFTPAVVLCGCLLPYFGFVLSGLIALACRMPRPTVIAIMMETSFQNTPLALSIVTLSIQDKIIQTLTKVGPYSVLIFSQVPIVFIEICLICKRRLIPMFREKMAARKGIERLDEQLIDDAYGDQTESNVPISGSQFEDSHGLSTSEETKRFFSRKKDYFGKELVG